MPQRARLRAFLFCILVGGDLAQPRDEVQSEDLNPYKILGVEPGLSSSELHDRYRQLMSASHPDKVAQLDPEIQAFASERSRRIIEAYQAISAGES